MLKRERRRRGFVGPVARNSSSHHNHNHSHYPLPNRTPSPVSCQQTTSLFVSGRPPFSGHLRPLPSIGGPSPTLSPSHLRLLLCALLCLARTSSHRACVWRAPQSLSSIESACRAIRGQGDDDQTTSTTSPLLVQPQCHPSLAAPLNARHEGSPGRLESPLVVSLVTRRQRRNTPWAPRRPLSASVRPPAPCSGLQPRRGVSIRLHPAHPAACAE